MPRVYARGIVFCLLSLVLLSGCGSPAPTATPQPAATPLPATSTPAPPTNTPLPPTATPQPTATPTIEPTATAVVDLSLPVDWVAFRDDARGLLIQHPPVWEVTQPSADKLAELFAQAEEGAASQSIQAILRQLTQTPGALDHFAALGFLFDDPTLADNKFVSNFTALVVPAEGLTLDTYAGLAGTQLESVDAIAVQSAQVESGLRRGGLDVASLRYTLDGAAFYGLPDGTQIDGWQVALYDASGKRLLILSLTAVDANFPPLEKMFRRLIYHLEFE